MDDPSSALNTVIRAMSGESDVTSLFSALRYQGFARVVALAKDTHPIVRIIAALYGNLMSLPDLHSITDPATREIMRIMIETPEGNAVLKAWAEIVRAGQGVAHAADLIARVKNKICEAGVAATLIGPCDDSASLLETPKDIAFTVRRWGQSEPDNPIAWMSHLSEPMQKRLLCILAESPFSFAQCLPWLPPDCAATCNLHGQEATSAIHAFAIASHASLTLHADIVAQIAVHARIEHLESLIRLALVMETNDVWTRVHGLLHEHPNAAFTAVAAAPWNALPACIHDDINALAARVPVCAAIVAARGRASVDPDPAYAAAFFAALDPDVWNDLPAAAKRQWRRMLHRYTAYLAVRSLGLLPDMLAIARLDDRLIASAHIHASDLVALHASLFPVAMRDLSPSQIHALIAAMPSMPSEPGAFFCIASEHSDATTIATARTALQSPADLADAIVLQRCASSGYLDYATWEALVTPLRGRTWDDLAPFLTFLDDRARDHFTFDSNAMSERLAHPDHRDALRDAIDFIARLAPEDAIPMLVGLKRWTIGEVDAHVLADCMLHALRKHGKTLVTVIDSLADEDLRKTILPLPDEPSLADALRHLACNDPVIAHRLARAIQVQSWHNARAALCAAALDDAYAIFNALPDAVQSAIFADGETAFLSIARNGHMDNIRIFWRSIRQTHPLAAIALATIACDDLNDRCNAASMLAQHPDIVRVSLPLLHPVHSANLLALDPICVAVADLDGEMHAQIHTSS